MDENQQVTQSPEAVEMPQNNAKRNLGVMVAFLIVLLVVAVVVIARMFPHTQKNNLQSMNQTRTVVPVANVMYQKLSPTPVLNTSNAQLDQDVQNAQSSLNTVDTNLNTTDQAISNQSADIPQ